MSDAAATATTAAAASRPPGYPLVVAVLAVAGLVDVGGAVTAGVSGNALLAVASTTLLALAVLVALTAVDPRAAPLRLVAVPLGAPLLLWAMVGCAVEGATREALQNVVVLAGFVLAAEAAALLAWRWPTTRTLLLRVIEIVPLPAAVWSLGQSVGVLPLVLGDRTFALAVLPAFLVNRFSSAFTRRASLAVGALYLAAVVLSLSRTAAALMLLIVVVAAASRPGGRGRGALTATAASVIGGAAAVAVSGPLRDRVFGGDQAVEVGDVVINTSGRSNLWLTVADGIGEHPWVGHGLGSSHDLIARTYVTITQVHNDYLRLLYDLGIVGAVFWLVLVGGLVVAVRRAAPSGRALPLTALTVMALAMTTDNVVVYAFVLVPFGVLLGIHLAPTAEEAAREGPGRPQLLHATEPQWRE